MAVKAPLGPHQERWLSRIKAAGGIVEMEIHRNGQPTIWIQVKDGKPIRLPVRMFESLVQRDLLMLFYEDEVLKIWKLGEEF